MIVPSSSAPSQTSRAPEDRAIVRLLTTTWGERVAAARAERSMSQSALAGECGVSQQTISKIERGRMLPLDPLKLRLARTLELEPAELFRWPTLGGVADRGGAAQTDSGGSARRRRSST